MKLDEIKSKALKDLEIAENATQGPWVADDGAVICGHAPAASYSPGFGFSSIPSQYYHGDDYETPEGSDSDNDAEFIAHSRLALPASARNVLKLIEALEKCRERLEECTIDIHGEPDLRRMDFYDAEIEKILGNE